MRQKLIRQLKGDIVGEHDLVNINGRSNVLKKFYFKAYLAIMNTWLNRKFRNNYFKDLFKDDRLSHTPRHKGKTSPNILSNKTKHVRKHSKSNKVPQPNRLAGN